MTVFFLHFLPAPGSLGEKKKLGEKQRERKPKYTKHKKYKIQIQHANVSIESRRELSELVKYMYIHAHKIYTHMRVFVIY